MRTRISKMSNHQIVTVINLAFMLCLSPTTSSQATTLKPLSNCRKPLGMDDGAIPNSAISASSTYNDKDVGPINARIRNDKNGGAWCPENVIKDGVYEWIQIDLQAVKVITHVETQGRFAKGQGKEFVSKYRLEYKRVDGGKFVVYKNNNGNETFTGNTDTHTCKINEINPPIISRWIRLVPLDDHANMVCLRLELHGCPWRDGILSYNMPQGEKRVGGLELFDLTYDGEIFYVPDNKHNDDQKNAIAERYSEMSKVKTKKIKKKNHSFSDSMKNRNIKKQETDRMIWLYGGLGQLVDGSEGHGIFNLATDKPVHKAKEWVGWKNDSIWKFMESNNKVDDESENKENDDYYEYDEIYDNGNKVGRNKNKEISFTKNDRKNHDALVNEQSKTQADGQVSDSKIEIDDDNESEKTMGKKNREFYTSMLEHYNTQMYNEPVVSILFEFEKPRNFSSVRIHCNNMFRKGVKIFKLAVLYFSLYPDFRDEPSLFRKKKDYADFKAQKPRHRRAMKTHYYHNFPSNLHSHNYKNLDDFMNFYSSNHSALQHSYQQLNHRRQSHRELKLQNQTFEKQGLKKISKMPPNKIKTNIKTPQKRNLRYLTSKHYPQNDHHYKKGQNRLFLENSKVSEYSNKKIKPKLRRNKRRIENPKLISPKAFSSKQRREDSFKHKHNGPNSPPVIQFFSRDKLIDYARNVNIMIGNRIGKYVRVDLYFDDKWLLISEVRFESEVLSENYTHFLYSRNKNRKGSFFSKSNLDDRLIGIVIGAVGIPILIILVLVLLCLYCHLKHKGSNEKLADEETKSNMHTADEIPLKKIENNGFFTYNNTIFNQNSFTLRQNSIKNNNTFFNNNHFKNHNNDTNTTTVTSLGTTLRKNVDHDKILKYTLNSHGTVDQVTWEGHLNDPFVGASPMQRELPDIPLIPFDSNDYLTDTNNSTYAVPDHYRIAHPPSAYPTNHIYHFDLLGDQSINQCSKTLLTHKGGTNDSMIWNNLTQLKKRNLRLIKKLGEGVFGEVHLCEVDTSVQASGLNKSRVIGAVKVLTKNDSFKIKDNFLQEVKVMSKLNDPNVVSVLGVCLKDLPWFVVFEYNSKGDLNQFLRSRVVKGNDLYEQNAKYLSYGSLVYMASQISSGMKYLEGFNVVHRDLATRNCLVGNQLQVKISDLGVISDLYKSDYFRLQGHTLLPIRWMSWEAVVLGKFSSKSDVWSFGVTLWEVLIHAMKRPFEDLSDQEVLEGLAQCPQTGVFTLCLEQPVNCPREIYDLMCECWNPDEMKRPSFNEICMFLSRKNMGYKPSDDYVDDGKSVLNEYETVVETGFPFADGETIAGENQDAKKNEIDNNIEKSSSKRSVLV